MLIVYVLQTLFILAILGVMAACIYYLFISSMLEKRRLQERYKERYAQGYHLIKAVCYPPFSVWVHISIIERITDARKCGLEAVHTVVDKAWNAFMEQKISGWAFLDSYNLACQNYEKEGVGLELWLQSIGFTTEEAGVVLDTFYDVSFPIMTTPRLPNIPRGGAHTARTKPGTTDPSYRTFH